MNKSMSKKSVVITVLTLLAGIITVLLFFPNKRYFGLYPIETTFRVCFIFIIINIISIVTNYINSKKPKPVNCGIVGIISYILNIISILLNISFLYSVYSFFSNY